MVSGDILLQVVQNCGGDSPTDGTTIKKITRRDVPGVSSKNITSTSTGVQLRQSEARAHRLT